MMKKAAATVVEVAVFGRSGCVRSEIGEDLSSPKKMDSNLDGGATLMAVRDRHRRLEAVEVAVDVAAVVDVEGMNRVRCSYI